MAAADESNFNPEKEAVEVINEDEDKKKKKKKKKKKNDDDGNTS